MRLSIGSTSKFAQILASYPALALAACGVLNSGCSSDNNNNQNDGGVLNTGGMFHTGGSAVLGGAKASSGGAQGVTGGHTGLGGGTSTSTGISSIGGMIGIGGGSATTTTVRTSGGAMTTGGATAFGGAGMSGGTLGVAGGTNLGGALGTGGGSGTATATTGGSSSITTLATGGISPMGGAGGAGGAELTGGATSTSTAGTHATGGLSSTNTSAVGGDGASATGGTKATGGQSSTVGGTSETGGSSATGGSATGGTLATVGGSGTGGEGPDATVGPLRSLDVALTGMTADVNQLMEFRVINANDDLVCIGILDPLPSASYTFTLPMAIPEGIYRLDFFADVSGDRVYTPISTDEAWSRPISAGPSPTVNFVHNTTYTDISTPAYVPIGSDFTFHATGMTPHVGQRFELRVIVAETGQVVGLYRLAAVPAATFDITIPSIIANSSAYRIDFWADENNNGQYDSPPTDHAWRITGTGTATGLAVSFAHNTDFTDVNF